MKRIIDGVTYNTDTSTKLATSGYETNYNHVERPCLGTLYQTRGGAYFVHELIELGWDREEEDNAFRHRCSALSSEQAHKWIMTGDVDILHNPFEEPPEAVAENEPSSTIYVRVPASLKQRIEAAAKADGLSGNAWTMRCVERCLQRKV